MSTPTPTVAPKALANPIDDNRQGLIGKPVPRVDGVAKVTGTAPYAYEFAGATDALVGVLVEATIARGRIAGIDTVAAERAPGVRLVMTHRNAPAQGAYGPARVPARFERAKPLFAGRDIRHYGEPVALVVADSFENARAAAALVRVDYAKTAGKYTLQRERAYAPETINVGMATDTAKGDFDGGFAASAVRVESRYDTSHEHHNPIEPHATLAEWKGDTVTLRLSTQAIANVQKSLANTLQIAPGRVRVLSPYIGGGFGAKLGAQCEAVAAALASRALGTPVKVAHSRRQMFHNSGHRPKMHQRVRLGASADGRLQAIGHEAWITTSPFEQFAEQTATLTRSLYAAPDRMTAHRLIDVDLPPGDTMRAPGEAPGSLALESAMDELAHVLRLDPVELRIRNEPDRDPERDVPFSSRGLVACLRDGARRFGWSRRNAVPGSVRDGRWLIGMGMSAAIRPNYIRPCQTRVRLTPDGRLHVELAMTDIGTGSYTILQQVAAEMLGLPFEAVTVTMGDSALPPTPGSGGSFGAASSSTAVFDACTTLRARLAELHDFDIATATFTDGRIRDGRRSATLASLAKAAGGDGLVAEGRLAEVPAEYRSFSQHSYGAHFVEVAVDADTGEVRVRRMLGVFDAGRILNPRTAHSQIVGGMIWGLGEALLEESVVDPRFGQFVTRDLADYHVACHADVPRIDAFFLPGRDDKANPLGIKGVGELGICGSGAAVANAIFNASGVRVRSFPITLDKVLAGLSAA